MVRGVVRSTFAIGLVVALGATACSKGKAGSSGAPKGVAPDAYVAAACGAISEWEDSVQTLSSGLTAQLQSASSLDAAKQEFVSYVDQNVTAVDTMVSKVKAIGSPAVADGDHIQSEVVAALEKIEADFAEAKSKAEQLDTSSPTAFSNGVTDVTNTLDQELSNLGDPLGDVSDKALDDAANANATCQKLQSSG